MPADRMLGHHTWMDAENGLATCCMYLIKATSYLAPSSPQVPMYGVTINGYMACRAIGVLTDYRDEY